MECCWFPRMVSMEMNHWLVWLLLKIEVKAFVDSIKMEKVPRPNGFTLGFFKQHWNQIGADIMHFIHSVFDGQESLQHVYQTFISLIPKKPRAMNLSEFRPIACLNIIYHIFAKLLLSRIAKVLPKLLLPHQTTFMKEQIISDNTMLAKKMLCGFD